MVESYSRAKRCNVHAFTEQYLKESQVSEQNVALLKNAIEFWKEASNTSDAIAPILYKSLLET
jgi:hypothetical protein